MSTEVLNPLAQGRLQEHPGPGCELIAGCWTTAGAADAMSKFGDDRSPVPIHERIEAARVAGFKGFGIRHLDLLDIEEGIGFAEFRRLLDDNGLIHLELEFLEGWYQHGEARKASDTQRADLLRAAKRLGARHIKVGPNLEGGEYRPDIIAPEFANLAEQAEAVGTKVGLEPMPFSDVRTPQMGLEVVELANHPAGGLLIDIWHVARAGVDFGTLAALPPAAIVSVELNDAVDLVVGSMLEDTFNWRRFPGEGDFDVQGFVDSIRATGYEGPWGVEMLSTEFRQMPVREATQRAFRTSMRFLSDPISSGHAR